MLARISLRTPALRDISRYYSSGTSTSQSSSSSASLPPVKDVEGLSSACIEPASEPVGPGVDPKKTGPYKSPEYFQYNTMSYFEAEVEMAKFRVPQPSALKKPES